MARLARFAWTVLVYNLAVIAWGAYVRATGSGAGCGNHWPLCNGQVVPRADTIQLMIEFSHRLTSGLALVSVVALFFWARRLSRPGDPVRVGATLSLMPGPRNSANARRRIATPRRLPAREGHRGSFAATSRALVSPNLAIAPDTIA